MDVPNTALRTVAPGQWRVCEHADRGITVEVIFSSSDVASRRVHDLEVQVERWVASMAALGRGAIAVPRREPADESTLRVWFDAPASIGRDLPALDAPLEGILSALCKVAVALDELHARGLVHAGLGLPSLWWTAEGAVQFPDVGLIRMLDGLLAPPSDAAVYRAPELWHDAYPTAASDQYSLAVITYELLTGHDRRAVADVEGIGAIEPLIIDEAIPLFPGAPAPVYVALRRALSSAPRSRFPSCAAFIEALEGHLAPLLSLPTRHPSLDSQRSRGSFRSRIALVVAAGTSLVVIVGLLATGDRTRTQRSLSDATRSVQNRAENAMEAGGAIVRRSVALPERAAQQATPAVLPPSNLPERTPSSQPIALPSAFLAPSTVNGVVSTATVPTGALPNAPLPAPPSPATGTLVLTLPRNSRVYLDGVLVGTDPRALSIPAGTHDIDVATPGSAYRRFRMTITSGDTTRLDTRSAR